MWNQKSTGSNSDQLTYQLWSIPETKFSSQELHFCITKSWRSINPHVIPTVRVTIVSKTLLTPWLVPSQCLFVTKLLLCRLIAVSVSRIPLSAARESLIPEFEAVLNSSRQHRLRNLSPCL